MKKDQDIPSFLQMAKESLEVAEDLFKSKHYGFSASRSYYSMFYSAEAVLLTKDLSFSSIKPSFLHLEKSLLKVVFFPNHYTNILETLSI